MTRTRIWLSLAMGTAAVATLTAGAGIWLVLSRPVAVAEALDGGTVTPLVQALAAALGEVWRSIARWL